MNDIIDIGNIDIPLIKGNTGATGQAGKIESLTVTMLPSTASPTVENLGTQTNARYVLGIPRGTGIASVTKVSGELIITLTDGNTINLGEVDGLSITNVYIDEDLNFVVEFSDSTSIVAGNIETAIEGVVEEYLENYYDKDTADSMFALIDETGNKIDISINSSTYVMTLTLKDKNNNTLSTGTVDLPLESVVVSGSYDSVNKKIVLTLQSGSTIEFSVADLVSGLQSEITSSNKLSADLVDDTSTTHKFTTSANLAKLSGIETGAEVNVLEGVQIGGADLPITNKKVNIPCYTKTEIDNMIGDIGEALDLINGESVGD